MPTLGFVVLCSSSFFFVFLDAKKLFEYQMMAFRIALKCSWDARTNEFKEYED